VRDGPRRRDRVLRPARAGEGVLRRRRLRRDVHGARRAARDRVARALRGPGGA
jgi:hypothetical protein